MTETAITTTHDRVSKCKRLRDFIIKINLFENKETLSLIDQLFATRIFLSLLIISLTIIVVFTGSTFQTHIVTIQSPSENTFRQLYIQYSNTLSCLCTQSSILQNEFISFNPEYHPICTSQFVNQTFISSLSDYNMSDYWPLDYRTMAASHFLVLATLCRTVTQMVSDVLEEFTSQYISTNQVLSQDIFDGQITALIAKLKAMTIADNKYTSDFVLFNIFRNEIISGLRTNYFMRVVPGTSTYSTNISQYQTLNTTCSCDRNITCVHQAGIYNGTGRVGLNLSRTFGNLINDPLLLLTIPGIMVGCLPYTSLLQSTLECFYYQSCINQIQTFINGFSLVLPLVSTYFQQNTTVSDLFDQLFIESWNEMSNFSDYFRACSPYLCTYSYDRRYDILYVIVTIISLFGGLRIILFYFAPFIVNIIRRVQKIKYCQKNSDEIITVIPVTPKQSLKDRFISLVRQTRQEIVTFNMFPLSSDIRDGIYSTRLYFFLLSIGIVILVFYSSLSVRIQSITIYNPSLSEYERLYAEYPSALICPCTQLSVAHSLIIDIKPSYHQVCSSDFVKDDVWLLYFSGIKGSLYSADFRTIGFPLFTILQTLCMMSNETVTNQLIVFNNTQFVSGRVLTRDTFNSQTYALIQEFQQQTIDSFNGLFKLVRASIQLNQFIVLTSTNALLGKTLNYDITSMRYVSRSDYDDSCSCGTSTYCTRPLGFYCTLPGCFGSVSRPVQNISGLVESCLPVDTLLESSLECFYNISCIQMLLEWRSFQLSNLTIDPRFYNITPLNPMFNIIFSPDTTFDVIASELFIENWTDSTDFSSYYNHCAPNECIYTYAEKFNRAYITATILGIVGGLSVALRILIPLIVKLLRRMYYSCCKRQQHVQSEPVVEISIGYKFLIFINHLRHSIRTMNLYRKVQTGQMSEESQTMNQLFIIHRQQIATRFYVILFCFGIVGILLFTGLNSQIHSVTISAPTEFTFEQLKAEYSSTFTCPCSQVAIEYSKFLSVNPVAYHQVCSSNFVLSSFINSLWGSEDLSTYSSMIDLKVLSTQFRLLASLCSLAKNAFDEKIKIFSSQEFISVETLTRDSFQTQINSIIQNFIVQTPTDFRRTHRYITDMFHANQLHNIFYTNWNLTLTNSENNYFMSSSPMWYNQTTDYCSCATSSICTKSFFINNNKKMEFPGLVYGCLPIYGLRLSTLECLYNYTCLKTLANFIGSSYIPNPLNISIYTRFTPVSTIPMGTLIDELFIEIWQNTSNYSGYFSVCAPLTCQYTYMERNNAIYMLTTFLGLYGGLTVGLKFVVWHVLCVTWKVYQWLKNR